MRKNSEWNQMHTGDSDDEMGAPTCGVDPGGGASVVATLAMPADRQMEEIEEISAARRGGRGRGERFLAGSSRLRGQKAFRGFFFF